MKKFLSEFKEFALRGNVLDMAIGVVIGGAFGKILFLINISEPPRQGENSYAVFFFEKKKKTNIKRRVLL